MGIPIHYSHFIRDFIIVLLRYKLDNNIDELHVFTPNEYVNVKFINIAKVLLPFLFMDRISNVEYEILLPNIERINRAYLAGVNEESKLIHEFDSKRWGNVDKKRPLWLDTIFQTDLKELHIYYESLNLNECECNEEYNDTTKPLREK